MGVRRVILVTSITENGVVRVMPMALPCAWCDRVHEVDADQLHEAAEDFPYEIECGCGARLQVAPAEWPLRGAASSQLPGRSGAGRL